MKEGIKIDSIDKLVNDKITNLDNTISDNPLLWKNHFRMVVVGGSGCGKTSLVFRLILNYMCFDHYIIVSKTIDHPKYVWLQKYFSDLNEKVLEKVVQTYNKGMSKEMKITVDMIRDLIPPIAEFYSDVNDSPSPHNIDTTKRTLIMFDDVMLGKQSPQIEWYSLGRNKNSSVISCYQHYHAVPLLARNNSNVYILFHPLTQTTINNIYRSIPTPLERKDFIKIIKRYLQKKHDYIVLDVDNDMCMQMRSKGFLPIDIEKFLT